jgi:histone acetyltransferase (RNA polymerase elongator complex component)
MKAVKHSNIPIFIPELACPHQCVFCDQEKISGSISIPSPSDVPKIIEQYLETMNDERLIDIAFFGGNFTGIQLNLMQEYLEAVNNFVRSGKVNGIRLSTRPDYIDSEKLTLLKKFGVTTIELGAQSTNPEVLKKAGRGHTPESIQNSSNLILDYGFELGLQMMIGLPGDSLIASIQTAEDIVDLGATNTRIYPTLVIKGTVLEKLFKEGNYKPLEFNEAVEWTKEIMKVFEENNVSIIRMGLHPSKELVEGKSLIAGPYHLSFKELVLTERWKEILSDKLVGRKTGTYEIRVNPKQVNYVIGYKSKNRNYFANKNFNLIIKGDPDKNKYEIEVSNS